jgi:hypothetical protein
MYIGIDEISKNYYWYENEGRKDFAKDSNIYFKKYIFSLAFRALNSQARRQKDYNARNIIFRKICFIKSRIIVAWENFGAIARTIFLDNFARKVIDLYSILEPFFIVSQKYNWKGASLSKQEKTVKKTTWYGPIKNNISKRIFKRYVDHYSQEMKGGYYLDTIIISHHHHILCFANLQYH